MANQDDDDISRKIVSAVMMEFFATLFAMISNL